MILRLQHIGTAHRSHASAAERLRQVGLEPAELRTDQGRGFQLDSRKLLGNECWLHVVHNWNPEARVCQYLRTIGEGLEHIAIETDDIERAVARVKESAPIFEDRIFHAADGFEAFVYPADACGFTVELIQPHASSWNWPDPPPARVSPMLSLTHLAEVVAGAADPQAAGRRFEELFDVGFEMDGASARVPFGNGCVLRFQTGRPGLRSLVLETADVDADRGALEAAGTPVESGSTNHGQELRIPAGVAGFEVVVRSQDSA
ncbi:MAG: hypothetical protein F4228_01625 [Acidobacteria bacterium]|nr:hypothetical protein [Acidobacteriota bacterium]MYF13387.1 hypothetical protein [Acidobacteriota bacterium]MYI95682.1 hypothetical protein [Acidobacteriota bacterium]